MSDEDALLAAIAAHPDEDTPRLAYADWLDEHDRPIRAEFIRIQCALAQRDGLSDEERRKLAQRQEYIFENHRRDILGPLGADFTASRAASNVAFERGFAVEPNVDHILLRQRADAIAALRPRPRVRLKHMNGSVLKRPELAVVTALTITDPGAHVAVAVAACLYLKRLESLEWAPNQNLGDAGLELLAVSGNLPALTELRASSNGIGDAGVSRLVTSPLWPRLKLLDLSFNPLTDAATEHLAGAPDNAQVVLHLRGTTFGTAARQRLTRKFGKRVSLN
jgi:uncharacterized protein (TIGR02996 family)